MNNIRKEKKIMDTVGRAPALNNEAKSYIRSLINTDKPKSIKNIIKLTQDWLRMKGVVAGTLSEHSNEDVASDKSIRNYLNTEIEDNDATEVVPDTNTLTRDRETKESRNVLSWAALVFAYCKDLYPELVFNWDATSLKFGDMIEGDEACKVLVYANDLRGLKRSGKSLKAQVGDEFEKVPGVFLKKYHFTNSAGQKAPLVYLIEDETISADECLWYKVPGLSCDNSVGGYGFVAFCRTIVIDRVVKNSLNTL